MPSIRQLESIGAITKTSSTTISLAASRVNVGGQQYTFSNPISLNVSTLGAGGLDASVQNWKLYYLYVVISGGIPRLIGSLSPTLPSGFSAARRVGFFDTNASSQINGASDVAQGTVGQVRSAVLTESQFQSLNGIGWILADGRNVAGSTFATVTGTSSVPDLRGVALRGKNNGRADGNENPGISCSATIFDGEQYVEIFGDNMGKIRVGQSVSGPGIYAGTKVTAILGGDSSYKEISISIPAFDTDSVTLLFGGDLDLGEFQNDAFQGHVHKFTTINDDFNNSGGSPHGFSRDSSGRMDWYVTDPLESNYGTPRLAVETRMKNVTVNFFIKVN